MGCSPMLEESLLPAEGSAMLQVQHAKKSAISLADPNKESTTVAFSPGEIGMGADWGNGLVIDISDGGQAEKFGIQAGMRITAIDGEAYRETLLDAKIAGDQDYLVEFS